MNFDEVLKILGTFGRYQKIMFGLVCLVGIPAALNNMTIVFLAAVPDHWCRTPTADHLNLSRDDLLNLTIPVVIKDGESVYSRCERYEGNYTGWTDDQARAALAGGAGGRGNTSRCEDGWEYDREQYKSTIVTQVCGGGDEGGDEGWMRGRNRNQYNQSIKKAKYLRRGLLHNKNTHAYTYVSEMCVYNLDTLVSLYY